MPDPPDAVEGSPAETEALFARAVERHRAGDLATAADLYARVIVLRPDAAQAYSNRGAALRGLGRYDDALASYDRAAALKPDGAEIHANRASVLSDLMRFEEAEQSAARAIVLSPGNAEAHYNRGIALHGLHRLDDAIAGFDEAVRLRPDHADAQWNKALSLLFSGDFERGWRQYEWRWALRREGALRPRFLSPPWLGETPVAGKTVLLHAEQGLGDTIQFSRFAPQVSALGARVILQVQRPLVGLLASLPGEITIIGDDEPTPTFNLHCPLMSLPLALGLTPEAIPYPGGYLEADPVKADAWSALAPEGQQARVGLVWAGGLRSGRADLARRDLPLAALAALRDLPCRFYSLQKGEAAESDLQRSIAQGWGGPAITDLASQLHDFADTAAAMANLDLIISVDTSSAHLAGAMGRPVWILNRHDSCWRWILGREDSPWYASARLFTQGQPGDWDGVMRQVAAALSDRLGPG